MDTQNTVARNPRNLVLHEAPGYLWLEQNGVPVLIIVAPSETTRQAVRAAVEGRR